MPKKNKKGGGKRKYLSGDLAGFGHDLRDVADPLIRLAKSPIVAELVASALIAGAGALNHSEAGEEAARKAEDGPQTLIEGAEEAAIKGADLASLVGYSIAIVAGEIARRVTDSYERQVSGSEAARASVRAATKVSPAPEACFSATGLAQVR